MATGIDDGSAKTLFINGIMTSGTGSNGAIMVALPLSFLKNPRKILIAGVGTGTSLTTAPIPSFRSASSSAASPSKEPANSS